MRKITFFAVMVLAFTPIYATEDETKDTEAIKVVEQPFRQTWRRSRSERAVIHWHDGIQEMAVSPRLAADSGDVWIFPLKCDSEQVECRLIDEFPQIRGADGRNIATGLLDNVKWGVVATQLWTIPLYYFRTEHLDYGHLFGFHPPGAVDSSDVVIEFLEVDSVAALAQQLRDRGQDVEEADIERYADYINPDYSLLAAWREVAESDEEQSDVGRRSFRRRPCIYVTFPSEKPFYPVLYRADRPGRLSCVLTGFWRVSEQGQDSPIQCRQYFGQDIKLPDSFRVQLPKERIALTEFSFGRRNEPAQINLDFIPGRLDGFAYTDTVLKMPLWKLILLGLVVLAVVSYVSAGISGLLVYQKWQGFAGLGLWNLLTIIAMGIIMNYKKDRLYEVFLQNKWKARLFIILFSIIMVLLSFAVFAALKSPLQLR